MSYETMRAQVEGVALNGFSTTYPNVPIKFSNAPFSQPEGPWVSVHIVEGNSMPASMGITAVDRHVGFVQFDVLVPINTGTALADQIAEFAGNLYRRQDWHLSDGAYIRFKVPQYRYMGENDAYARFMMRCNYWRDEPAR
jgi:hypothetical protein